MNPEEITVGAGDETVTVSGGTTNVVGCGRSAWYRLDDSMADNEEPPPGGDHTIDWTKLDPGVDGDGNYSFTSDLRKAAANRTYTFTVQVRAGDDVTVLAESDPAVVTVVPAGPPPGRGP